MSEFTCSVCGHKGDHGPMIGQVSAPRCSTCHERSCIRHTNYKGEKDGRPVWECDKCREAST